MKFFISILICLAVNMTTCDFLKSTSATQQSPLSPDSSNLMNTLESDYFSNSLIPGRDATEKLKKIIESLVK
jgi:hypothetical protein